MRCILCNNEPSNLQTVIDRDFSFNVVVEVTCSKCGIYQVETKTQGMEVTYSLTAFEKTILSGLVRNYFDVNGKPFPTIDSRNYKIQIASASYPRSVDEHINSLLLKLAEETKYLGTFAKETTGAVWASRLFLPSGKEFMHIMSALKENELLNFGADQNPVDSMRFRIVLTYKGWNEVRELKSFKHAGNQAFVAMWFHHDLDEIYTDSIYPALRKVGYNPYRVDRANHNNRIDDEIISQIRKSRILICEVTGERSGVYYEAGFAQGLGIPVIWVCNNTWTTILPKMAKPNSTDEPELVNCKWDSRMHFDTRQFPHILWSTKTDLQKKLIDRIQALGLDLPEIQ